MDTLPPELIQKILLFLPYNDIISHSMVNRINSSIHSDNLFWMIKLEHDYPGSHIYIKTYNHFDKGIDTYKRWKMYGSWTHIRLCIERRYNDIAMRNIDLYARYMNIHSGIYIANYSTYQCNMEVLEYLNTMGILPNDPFNTNSISFCDNRIRNGDYNIGGSESECINMIHWLYMKGVTYTVQQTISRILLC